MGRTGLWFSIGTVLALAAGSAVAAEQLYDVRDYGARADGKTLCTQAIQKAIDKCGEDGGAELAPGTPEMALSKIANRAR
jgi:hypothetical protein